MANFAKNIEDATDKELLFWINTLDPNYTKLASDELTRRGIRHLNESIDNGTSQSRESSEVAERFTAALFLLAVVQLLVAVFQLILSFAYSESIQNKILGVTMVVATAVILTYFAGKIFKGKRSKP